MVGGDGKMLSEIIMSKQLPDPRLITMLKRKPNLHS